MRNLKKILALVLALVMSLSLMAVASADDELNLGDVSEVYAESVDVLTSLKVFQGNKGEFLPKTNITRAEVAAIIYRIVTGDVEDTQKSIYADYNKFSDVTSDAWYAGYVNYCANAEYVKGVGYDANGKAMFKPQQNVTGYEALAMILRAIGYDRNNEFTGPSWQIQTAATAKNRGIINKIAEGTLGGAATREVVAEILCKTILVPKADYSLAFGYRIEDANGNPNKTLAYETFKMEKIDGVVVANEYANLETQTTLGAEQTKLVTSVGDYTLNVGSTLDDIGESRYVYVKPATGSTRYDLVCSKVYETEGMNKVYEVTEKADIKDGKFNTVTGMTKDAATEEYINFGPSTNWKSDWRIRYVVSLNVDKSTVATFTDETDETSINRAIAELHGKFNLPVYDYPTTVTASNVTNTTKVTTVYFGTGESYILTWKVDNNNPATRTDLANITYSKEFAIKDDIVPTHQGNIEQIFNVADRNTLNYNPDTGYVISNDGYLVGEVYVGTTSLEDVSDKMSYEQFKTTYIVADDEDIVSGNEYGNWLKVIDNDNDNVADYVLKVVYTFAQVTAVDSNGKATLSTKDQSLTDGDSVNNLTSQTVVCADELAVGNVVYYAVIDDKAQTYVPEMITTKFDKVDRNAKTATAVENDTTYNEGGVHNHTGNLDIEQGVANLSGTYTYDVYLTRGGHLGVFTHNPTSTFTLLTNGWYDQRRGGVEYAALAYIDGKQVDTDVTLGGSLFIGPDGGVLNNNWNAIKALGNSADGKLTAEGKLNYRADADHGKTLNDDDVRTAMVYLSADGTVIPVDRVFNNRTIYTIALDRIPNSNIAYYGDAYNTTIAAATAYDNQVATNVELRALSNTVYYYVYPAGNTVDNGRTNYIVDTYVGYANAPSVDRNVVEDIYAVATQTRRTVGNVLSNSTYYTANVVVVELSDSYQKKGEQIFIYDMPEIHNAVGTETIKYIDSNGADTTCEIDLNDSNVRRYLSAYGKITPGLYFKYPTTRDGIFTLEKMSADDIAANNYAVGQSITENAIGWNDWVQIQPWANDTWTSNTAHYNLGGSATSSKIYSLSYSSANNSTPFQVNYSATLTACAENGFLNNFLGEYESKTGFDVTKGIVEHGPWGVKNDATHNWAADGSGNCKGTVTTNVDTVMNHNDLLIHYGSGNKIIYAISFANFDANRTNTTSIIDGTTVVTGQNFAQDVWQSLVPGTTPVSKTSSFFGYADGAAEDQNSANTTIDLFYADAAKATDNTIFLTADASNEIVSVKVVSATNGGSPVTLENPTKNAWGEWTITVPAVANNKGAQYVVDVVTRNNTNTRYTFTVRNQNGLFGRLISLDATKVEVSEAGGNYTIKVGDGASTMISSLENLLDAQYDTTIARLEAFDTHGTSIVVFETDADGKWQLKSGYDQSCANAASFNITLKNGNNELSEIVDVIVDTTNPVTTTHKVTLKDYKLGLYKAYWAWGDVDKNTPITGAKPVAGTNDFEVYVPEAGYIFFVTEVDGAWTNTGGVVGVKKIEVASRGVWLIQAQMNNTDGTIAFTPTGAKTVSIAAGTVPAGSVTFGDTAKVLTTETATSFEIEVANAYIPSVAATVGTVSVVKGDVGANTTKWTVNVSGLNAASSLTVSVAPRNVTLGGTLAARKEATNQIAVSNITATWTSGDGVLLPKDSVEYEVTVERSGDNGWVTVTTETITGPASDDTSGTVTLSKNLTGTFIDGQYRVSVSAKVTVNGETVATKNDYTPVIFDITNP